MDARSFASALAYMILISAVEATAQAAMQIPQPVERSLEPVSEGAESTGGGGGPGGTPPPSKTWPLEWSIEWRIDGENKRAPERGLRLYLRDVGGNWRDVGKASAAHGQPCPGASHAPLSRPARLSSSSGFPMCVQCMPDIGRGGRRLLLLLGISGLWAH